MYNVGMAHEPSRGHDAANKVIAAVINVSMMLSSLCVTATTTTLCVIPLEKALKL
jgi:hypothetical protein